MTVAEIFKSVRDAAGYSQEQLSELIGIGQAAVSSIEKGKTPNPGYDVMKGLIFNVGANPVFVFGIDPTVDPLMHPTIIKDRLKGAKQSDLKKAIIKDIEVSLSKLRSLKD